MQTKKLQSYEKQAEASGQIGASKVLQIQQKTHFAQRNKVILWHWRHYGKEKA